MRRCLNAFPSGVSRGWSLQVGCFSLFATIVKSIKEVVKETMAPNKKTLAEEEVKEYSSSRQIRKSKFSQRFQMGGDQRQMTPSTAASDVPSDENQWVKRPPLSFLYDPARAADPENVFKRASPKDFGVLHDYLGLWTRNIQELLDRLRDTVPGEGMVGEVHYWRDMARILEAVNGEVVQSYVEVAVQILVQDPALKSSIDSFSHQKSRVLKGCKEARWNNKYMKVIEKPVVEIESAQTLEQIQVMIVVLLKSLRNVYESSNFYKEARIVSFIDRLLQCISAKIRLRLGGVSVAVTRGAADYDQY